MISAIILAAGESRRMGEPKALVKIGGTSFVRHIVETYKKTQINDLIVVTGVACSEIERELSGKDVAIIQNPQSHLGQLSSILTAIEALRPSSPDGVLIHPVDHPAVNADTINTLIDKFNNDRPLIVLPVCEGKRGHPVLFSAKLFDELAGTPLDQGARSVVWSHKQDVVEIPTSDKGILLDIDTREDYERLQRNL